MRIKCEVLTVVLSTINIFLIKYLKQYQPVNTTTCQSKWTAIPVLLTVIGDLRNAKSCEVIQPSSEHTLKSVIPHYIDIALVFRKLCSCGVSHSRERTSPAKRQPPKPTYRALWERKISYSSYSKWHPIISITRNVNIAAHWHLYLDFPNNNNQSTFSVLGANGEGGVERRKSVLIL